MLRELIESSRRFAGLPPVGYGDVRINWIVDLDARGGSPALCGPYRKGEAVAKSAPVVGDRAGTVSESNLKPALLVDKAAYALGVVEDGGTETEAALKLRGFRTLVKEAAQSTKDPDLARIAAFLDQYPRTPADMKLIRERNVKPSDIVAFKSSPADFPFEKESAQAFWRKRLEKDYAGGAAECCLCGARGPVLRILPWQIAFMGYSSPISSSNSTAFNSYGKNQTGNSPICFECGSKASQVLQHLLDSERHHRVLTRDEAKGQGRSPLKNQVAVFWVRDPLPSEAEGEERSIDVETLLAEALGQDGPPLPPPSPEQVKALYGLPLSRYGSAVHLDRNRFYLAVLSPNKSRLVVREWIDESLDAVCKRLERFDRARTIITPDGAGDERITIAEMIHSMRPWKAASAAPDANQVRGLIRTAYAGARAPAGLLEKAVLRFRIPDRAVTREEERELSRRRMALAATIKVALRFETKEERTLETLDATRKSAAHTCGELLAVLEEAQGRSSRWRVNATLVDRFYGSASTAPATILTLLVKRATQAHFPKIRKERLRYEELSKQLEDVMTSIDEAGGYPKTLTMREQGEFALGFYRQRAAFRSQRPGQTPGKENQ